MRAFPRSSEAKEALLAEQIDLLSAAEKPGFFWKIIFP